MEGLIIVITIISSVSIIFGIVVHTINHFFKQRATEGYKVKFMEEFDTTSGTIIKDFGDTLEVQCMKPNAYGEIIPTIIVVKRSEIFYF